MYNMTMDSPVGSLWLASDGECLTKLTFGTNPAGENPCPLLERTREELLEYFSGRRREFDIPLRPAGTAFQQADWRALCQIPYGETASYRDIAIAIGNPKACRAVGMANHANPIAIIIPCHRVVGRDGSLTGYGGGLEIKRFLLKLEGNSVEV